MKQIYSFSIAEISILLDIPFEIEISKEFSPFAETCQPYDTRVYFHKVSQLDVNLTDRICEIDLFSIRDFTEHITDHASIIIFMR